MKKTAEETEKTRISILDAALIVFSRDGLGSSTMETIATEAGVTRGAVYWHYRDKYEIFDLIVSRENERLKRIIETALSASSSPLERLRSLVHAVVENFFGNETFRQQIILTWYRMDAGRFGSIMSAKSEFVQDFLNLMENLLSQSQKLDEIRGDVNVHRSAYHLSCLINGMYRLFHVAPDWGRDMDEAFRLFDTFIDSLK